MLEENHLNLKRWERAKQLEGLENDPDLSFPLAWCKIPPGSSHLEERIRVYIIRIFEKDLICVKSYSEILPDSLPGTYWMTRGAISWGEYLREIVIRYQRGQSVPESFRPLRKMTSELLEKMIQVSDSDLPVVFSKLRDAGILNSLPILSQSTLPAILPWDNLKASFIDMKQTESPIHSRLS